MCSTGRPGGKIVLTTFPSVLQMSAISACIHCGNLTCSFVLRTLLVLSLAHKHPSAQKCVGPATHFTCSTTLTPTEY